MLLKVENGVNKLFRDLWQVVTIESWILKNHKFNISMTGKQGTQLYHQEAKGHKTPHLRETQGKHKVLHHGTHNLNQYYPTREGMGKGGVQINHFTSSKHKGGMKQLNSTFPNVLHETKENSFFQA